jgi:molybdopterin/thiamine biosynthesis adenylyltransferase
VTPTFATTSRTALLAAEALGGAPPAERLAALRERPILLAIDAAEARTRAGQLTFATAASLLGRLFDFAPAIEVAAPPVPVVAGVGGLAAGAPLAAAVVALLESLAAEPGRSRHRIADSLRRHPIALVVGDLRVDAVAVVHASGRGFQVRVGPAPAPSGPVETDGAFNPFGPLVAAALAAAEAAKHVFRTLAGPGAAAAFPLLERPVAWDLWEHAFDERPGPALPAALELGRFAVAGLGAVGAAAVWALAHVGEARGTVELVDDDRLDATNLERVLTARGADVGMLKVRAAARVLAGTRLRAVPLAARYGIAPPPGARATTILCGLDSGGGRRRLQAMLPRALYNGGTQGAELLVSRHVGLEGPCLECLYPESDDPVGRTAARLGVDRTVAEALVRGERRLDAEVLAAMRRRGGVHLDEVTAEALEDAPLSALEAHICSRAVVIEDLPEATISFTSALAGFLAAAELVKDRVAGARRRGLLDPARPAFRLDTLGGLPGPECVEAYVPRRDCACQEPETRRSFARARSR